MKSSSVIDTFPWSRYCHLPVSLSAPALSVLTLQTLLQRIFIHQSWPNSNRSKPPQILSYTQYHIRSDAHHCVYDWHSTGLYLVKNGHRMQCQLPNDAEWLRNVGSLKSTRKGGCNLRRSDAKWRTTFQFNSSLLSTSSLQKVNNINALLSGWDYPCSVRLKGMVLNCNNLSLKFTFHKAV